MTTFNELGLNSDIMKSLDDLGFETPTLIQEKSIPFLLHEKQDLIALAQTGTGKTAAYSLPILNQIKKNERDLVSIILCPTRELCLQISKDIKKFAHHLREISITAVYGGERIDLQIKELKRGTNIVVGTPGRVCDLIRRNVLKLQNVRWVVLDEADEMLDMGFKDDLDAILDQTPKTRQTLLFSATMSGSVSAIAKHYMKDSQEISAGEKNIGAEKVSHEYYVVQARDRFDALKRILDCLPGVYGILFCRTRMETQEVADKLKQANYSAEPMHGDISQTMRTKIMDRFRQKKIHLLVATDVAARGIDVSDLSHVINYNLPDADETYTHRSGRTGRAQKSGVSISIVNMREVSRIRRMEDMVGKKFEQKKVPGTEEILAKQVENFIEEMKTVSSQPDSSDKYYLEITKKLKEINKEELIKHLVLHHFKPFIDNYKNARDLNVPNRDFSQNSRRGSGNNVTLKISFGRKQGLDIKGLFSLINSNRNFKSVEIGRIDLGAEESVFSVGKEFVQDIVKHLKTTTFRGRKTQVIISGTSQSYSHSQQRRSYAPKKFERSKNNFRKKRY